MNSLRQIPELLAMEGAGGLIRIPNQIDVPVSARVLRIIDTPEFQRLKHISQLGFVSYVYPGATHTRFEHSLGVYRNALLFLRHLINDAQFVSLISDRDATVFILAALLHDIGHWPFCHPIEDLGLERVPKHEQYAHHYLTCGELAERIREDWQIGPVEVSNLINRRTGNTRERLLASILSGPIDIDKMDYLYRDSLHCGVPYGQNFDAHRLIHSLCLNQAGDRLAITSKGKTAAELMVFARYVMFSEVYWHHAVRSATAMFQRAFFLWYREHAARHEFESLANDLFGVSEGDMIRKLMDDPVSEEQHDLLKGLFGATRKLYKQFASFSCFEDEVLYRNVAHRSYSWLLERSGELASRMSQWLKCPVSEHQILLDAPPVGLEVQFDVQVRHVRENRMVALGELSPVVNTLAHRQFDDFVKQVRVFVAPELAERSQAMDELRPMIAQFLSV